MTHKYSIILLGALLWAGCSGEDATVVEPADEEDAVPVMFEVLETYKTYKSYKSYKSYKTYNPQTRAANGQTGFNTSENGHILHSGFGIFAREDGAAAFGFMSNQKVEYTFLANDVYDGYWSYQPLKYWPYEYNDAEQKSVPKKLCFCAYAPYVERDGLGSLPAGTTGIVGMSEPDAATPYIIYARGEKLEECVDLLWCYKEAAELRAVSLNMTHALARVGVSATLTTDKAANNISKVLIEQVTLSGTLAQKGKLLLAASGETPIWKVEDEDMASTDILVHSNPENHPASYGIVAESVRYIPGLPESWQPDGLQTGQTTNILAQDDDQTVYLLLIPQESLTLTAHVTLHVYYNDATDATVQRTGDPVTVASPLTGGVPYNLNLKIEL